MFLIEGKLEATLQTLMKDAAPREVGGIIISGKRVLVLTNHSDHPENQFLFYLSELRHLAEYYQVPLDRIEEDVVLWHTHPAGGVGPSREDMRNKTPLKHHLVLSYVDGDMVPTWY